MEVIGLGLKNTTLCPDELITGEKQSYKILTQSLCCSIILSYFLSVSSDNDKFRDLSQDMPLTNDRSPLNMRKVQTTLKPVK